MRQLLAQFGITTIGKLGRCSYCTRSAFVSAVLAWLLAFVFLAVTPWTMIAMALAATAAMFSILWLAHLTVFAARSARCRISTVTVDENGVVTNYSRRDLFPFFAKAFAFVALASVFQFIPAKARADDGCSGDTPFACGANWCCAASAIWYCQGYTGNVPNWAQLGSFCTNANSDEDVADLRSNCAILQQC
jgi:hypothetical protein